MKQLAATLLCLSLIATGIAAQEFADHPLVGSYEGSSLIHQERSVYHDYPVVTGYDDEAIETDVVSGSATMTLYDAPEEVSTFTVYATYQAFLESEGFEFLAQCKPGECPGDLLEEIYFLMPFADNGDYAHPAPFTNGSGEQSAYISAVKSDNGQQVYVNLLVAAGWAAYPQYRLDVVETGSNPGRIASSGDDHPVVGRYVGASDFHQEASAFREYTLATGADPAAAGVTDSVTVEGESLMTLYDAPWETSTYTIYATYLEFFQEEGFTVFLDYGPGECSSDLLSTVYDLQPFADHGGYYHPAIFSNGSGAHAALITARREQAGEALFVTVAIADGWADHPQYRLDVAQVTTNPGSISSSGGISTMGTPDDEDAAPESSGGEADESYNSESQTTARAPSVGGGFITPNGGFRAIAGIGVVQLLDPGVAGIFANTDDDGTITAQPYGIRNSYGPFAEVAWFPNANLGVGLGFSQFSSDEGFESDGEYYRTLFDMKLVRLVAITRMVGSDFPAAINMSLSGGVSIVELAFLKEDGAGAYDRRAEEVFGVVGCSVEMTVPILSFLHFSAGIDFFYVPFTKFEIEDVSGTPYLRTLHEGNLGGMSLRLGLVGSIGE